jgi:hypothetical protein
MASTAGDLSRPGESWFECSITAPRTFLIERAAAQMAANTRQPEETSRQEDVIVETPFDTVESAHEFVRLLNEQVLIVEAEIAADSRMAIERDEPRRMDALRIVSYKLKQLNGHLEAASRILNDLRALRRILTREVVSHTPT